MRPGFDPALVDALTFDCYGTLIDWLGGVRAAVRRLPSLARCDVERIVRDRNTIERELERGPYLPYSEILGESLRRAAALQELELSREDAAAFARSIRTWPRFAESPPMLERLARRYRLAILSNVDTDTLRASIEQLAAPIETFVTAEEVRSYKPARAHFDAGLRKLALARERVLHVACSAFHDIAPATALGWNAAWINRERESAPGLSPVIETHDLAGLARALGC